jgi:hypothetical protein
MITELVVSFKLEAIGRIVSCVLYVGRKVLLPNQTPYTEPLK